jgi:hypothetical protein
LNQTLEGQELIRIYYQWSPAIIEVMVRDEGFKNEVRDIIEEVLPTIGEIAD